MTKQLLAHQFTRMHVSVFTYGGTITRVLFIPWILPSTHVRQQWLAIERWQFYRTLS
jgi:hypothetical protein